MKQHLASLIALSLGQLLINPAYAQAEDGLKIIAQLAQVNGQALACQEPQIALQAKNLMLRHAPKTARFGSVFDDGTNDAYLAQTRNNTPCPDEASLKLQLTALALQLQATLPAAPVATSPRTTP